MKHHVLPALIALAPLPAQASQIALTCTADTLCGVENGCAPTNETFTAFVNPLGNPDEALVHYGHESLTARRTDPWAAFSFRYRGEAVSLQFDADHARFGLMTMSADGTALTYHGTCEVTS